MNLDFKIELKSDTCFGGENSVSGLVDTEIATDSNGIPIIPGRRVKGLFREACTELMEFGIVTEEKFHKMFGVSGGEKEELIFETLYPENYEPLCRFLDQAKEDANWDCYTKKEKVLEYYTAIRTQTALSKEGVAQKNSFRISRVVKKDITFEGEIHAGNLTQEEIEILKICAAMIRHMGTNRTRGMGNVKCTIVEKAEKPGYEQPNTELCDMEFYANELYDKEDTFIPVRILLNQPCVLEKNYISGSILKGLYISAYRKFSKKEELHEDEIFRKLFLENNVKFGYCWPIKKHSYLENEKLYWPTPHTLVKTKKEDTGKIYDLAGYGTENLFNILDEKERLKDEFVYLDSECVYTTSVDRMEAYHHRRALDRSKGHASAENGQLYSREALCPGQEFYGEIHGPKGLLKLLKFILPEGMTGFIGASRTAEYGKVTVSYKEYEDEEEREAAEVEDMTVITLLAPMVVMDEYGKDSTKIQDVVRTIWGETTERVESFVKEDDVYGYNAKWNMPVPQRKVLAPGSVIVIYDREADEDEIEKMNRTFYGLYQNEGYGRICVNWHGGKLELERREAIEKHQREIPAYEECKCKDYVEACLMDMLKKICSQEEASDFCYNFRSKLKAAPNSHVLSGMYQICKTSTDFTILSKQILKAAKRSTKKNSEWFKKIHEFIFAQENQVSNVNNEFIKQGKIKIERSNLTSGYQSKLQELLEQKAFQIFIDITMKIIYEVHLMKERGGK